ncbi:MAG TPA: NADH-quinone oxidoreductase subunit N [Pseudomonadales bacterium]|nr:NADH-quinone oxidoreductase subunit N [Pseudomonadales bacterium]
MKEQATALLPLLITTATVVAAMFAIAVKRNHRLIGTITIVGMNLALVSLVPGLSLVDAHSIAVTNLITVDGTAQFAMALILVTTLGVLTLCPAYFSGYSGHREELYLLLGVGTLGALTLACANHAATILLGLELLSLPMVGAVAYPIDRPRSIEGGVKYLILSAGASATLLFGLALIFAESGALDVGSIAGAIAGAGLGSPIVTVGAAMLLAGLAFKLSFVPFHQWTPDVYEAAPLPITAYLSTVVKLGAFVVALRLLHAGVGSASPLVVTAIVVLALASMLVGSVLALRQSNLKRLMAYSSIANFGYLAVVLAVPGVEALRAAGVYLVTYLVTSLGVFGVMTLVSSPMARRDREDLDEYRSLFWHRPYLAGILIAMLLSLAGIPLTAGFVGKLAVIGAGVQAAQWWLVGGVALASAIGVYYYLRVINALLVSTEMSPDQATVQFGGVYRAGALMLLLAAFVTLWLGVYPQPLFALGRYLAFP